MMHMHGAKFSATLQCRNVFSRVKQLFFIKSNLDIMKLRNFTTVELAAHLVYFFDSNAMLTGNGAANCNAVVENFSAQFFGAFQFAFVIGIKQY